MNKNQFRSEKDIYEFWEEKKLFRADPTFSKKPFSLLMPPPNLTGELHLGHAMQHSILDAIARYKRLQGFDVLLLPGVDHAGIGFESTFDKKLKEDRLSKEKLGREEWLRRAWQFKDEIYRSVSSTWRFMGLSADWGREVFTLDEGPRRAVFEQFKTYYERGLIYKGPYIVQWCPKCNTAIEDVEADYEEREDDLYIVRYKIEKMDDEYIEVATARPETIYADSGIAIYPNHPKFKKYLGQKAINPLTGTLLPIFEDSRVDKDFGTGALKITPGHDILDYQIGRDHGLAIIQVIDKSGHLLEKTGLSRLSIKEARRAAVEKLKKKNSLAAQAPYKHNVAICDRCKSVVEPLISEEWFVKVEQMAQEAIGVIRRGDIKFLPGSFAKILIDWLSSIHDWCISRSLWWGHRIPVWYKGRDIRVSLESPGEDWVQDEQVLDTWFSSGLWPLSTLGWPNTRLSVPGSQLSDEGSPVNQFVSSKTDKQKTDKQISENRKQRTDDSRLLSKYFPWDFEISASEIKFLWIARMIMISVYFTEKIPFKTMFFHGMLRDLKGRKFSKSLGNGIEPDYLIGRWGTDATRMSLYSYSVPGRDGRVSREIMDERGKNFRNFATKLRHIGRFILDLKPEVFASKLSFAHKDDKWIKEQFDLMAIEMTKTIEEAKLHIATELIYEFIWHKLADIYIEKSKKRRGQAQPVLEFILRNSLILLHPFMPYVTEEIYQKFAIREESIMLEKWPV